MRKILAVLGGLVATPALAQPMIVADSGDSAWVLAAAILVLVAALPGLVLLRGGERVGTAVVLATAIASIGFAIVGYSLAFGEGSVILGGLGNALLGNLADLRDGTTISEALYALFEMAVAAFALAIVASGIGGRARRAWFVPFALLWLLLVYVPVARWVWGGGWLSELGALDAAGGIVVQGCAGVAALVIGLLLRGRAEDEVATVPVAGVALLWLGSLALAGGSVLGGGDDAASAMLDTHLGASAGLLTAVALAALRTRAFSLDAAITGLVAGLAATAAGAGFAGPPGAIALGIVAAAVATALSGAVARLGTGRAGDVFVAHGTGGLIGALLFPLFLLPALGGPGLDEGAGIVTQLVAQVIAVVAVALWTAVATVIAALMVSMVVPMRVERATSL